MKSASNLPQTSCHQILSVLKLWIPIKVGTVLSAIFKDLFLLNFSWRMKLIVPLHARNQPFYKPCKSIMSPLLVSVMTYHNLFMCLQPKILLSRKEPTHFLKHNWIAFLCKLILIILISQQNAVSF